MPSKPNLRVIGALALTLLATLFTTATAMATTPPACTSIGEPWNYNGFFFGNYTAPSSDVQGRLAAAAKISISNYSIGDKLGSSFSGASLIAGGDLVFPSGRVYYGDILVGGSAAGVGAPVRNGLSASQHLIDHATLPVDFAGEQARSAAWSQALSALASNGTYVWQYGGLTLHGDNTSAVQVFAVPGDKMLTTNNFVVDRIPANATVLVNVSGTSTGIKNVSVDSLKNIRQRVLFNFYQATSLQFAGIAVQGSVLAPNADINNPQGVVWGSVVAKSWNGQMQLNTVPFVGCGLPSYAPNHPPVANAQSVSTNEDTARAITLTGSDADHDTLTYAVVRAPGHGSLDGTAPNLIYTPAADFNGSDSFDFQVDDGKANATATVSIAVAPVNDAPVANAQSVTTVEDTPRAITLTASDIDSTSLTYTITTPPAHGTLSGTAPNLSYTPAPDYNGSDQFGFSVSDGQLSASATVSIAVTAVNDAPIAAAQSLSADEDTPLAITLSGSDVDSTALSYAVLTPPAHGSLSGTAPNLTYTPAPNYNGSDQFSFSVSDGELSGTAAITITVRAVNDAPVAQPQALTVASGATLPVTLSATDVDGDALTYTIATPPQHGSLTGSGANIVYTPASAYSGSDSFVFRAADASASATATVAISVTKTNHAPVADAQSVATDEDTALAITLSGSDADGDTLSFTITQAPSHGTLGGAAPNLTYTPAADYNGSDSFDFQVSDGSLNASATVTISVRPVNDAPLITSTPPASARVNVPLNYTVTATDADGDTLSYSLDAAPAGMTIDASTGVLAWTPDAAAADSVAVTARVSDGHGGSATQSFTLAVVHANRAPTITSTPPNRVAERDTLNYFVTATDPDGDTLSYALKPRSSGAAIDASTGRLSWLAPSALAGPVLDTDAACVAPQPDTTPFVVISNWQLFTVPGFQDKPGWSLLPGDPTTALQANNDVPSMLVANDWLQDGTLEFSLRTNGGDDDYFGFVWGFRDIEHYYRFLWDHGNCHCMTIEKVDSDVPSVEAATAGITTLARIDQPWDYNIEYRVTLEVHPGSARIRISNGTSIIANIGTTDTRYAGGRYGFMNYSQGGTYYRVRPIPSAAAPDLVVSQLSYAHGIAHIGVRNRGAARSSANGTLVLQPIGFTLPSGAPAGYQPPALATLGIGAIDADQEIVIDQPIAVADPATTAFSATLAGTGIDALECDVTNNTRSAALFEATATDPGALSDAQLFGVQVDDVNDVPTFASTPPRGVTLGHAFSYIAQAHDADLGDRFRYALLQGPSGMTIDATSGLLLWTPQAADLMHTYPVQIQASDLRGASVTQDFNVLVQHDPVITSTPQEVAYGVYGVRRTYNYQVVASDPDGQTLSYRLLYGPSGMTIDASTGLVSWSYQGYYTPPAVRDRYDVSIEVSDGFGGRAVQSYTLSIVDDGEVNHPPIITSTPVVDAVPTVLYRYAVTATDADGDSLRYRLLVKPDAMQIDASTGVITWMPATVQYGAFDVRVEVSDGRGGVAVQDFQVSTAPGSHNHAPQITSRPSVVTKAGRAYRYQVDASDADGDSLQYTLLKAPAGMTLDASGLLQWSPAAETQTFVGVRVSDAESFVDQSWPLQVLPDYVALAATLTATPQYVNAGQLVTVQLNVSGAAGDPVKTATLDGAALALDGSGKATVTAGAIGRHDIVATVHDDFDTVTANTSFFVIDPSDTDTPVAKITSPDPDTRVTAPITVRGSASDSHFASWSLTLRPLSGNAPSTLLASGTVPVSDAPLAALDPTQLMNGQYQLVLQAADISGHVSTDTIAVRVTDDMKVGNFSISFEDAHIDVAGIPIRLTRTYDSRRRNESLDFGYGWSVGFQDVRIEESQTLGFSWQVSPNGGTFGGYCASSNGNRIVTITLPDGKVNTFRAKTVPECSPVAFVDVGLAFEPLDNTTSTLEQTDYGALQIGMVAGSGVSNLFDPSAPGVPVDPSHYRLTTAEGLIYDLDQGFGIRKVTDTVGNTLTYQSDGVIHSSGTRLYFQRDAQGRIARVLNNSNLLMTYDYDAGGNLAHATDIYSHATAFDYRYKIAHYLTDITDPRGIKAVRNEYDDNGRLTATIDADGHRIEYTHDIAGRLEQVRDRRGNLMSYRYDDRGRVLAETNALGETTQHTYDGDGNELSRIDPLGHETDWTYDTRGNKLTETDALHQTTTWTYNSRNDVLTQVDAAGKTVATNTYDEGVNTHSGKLLSTTDALGHTTRFGYDLGYGSNGTGELTSITDANGKVTSYVIDLHGFRVSQTDALGNVTTYTNNAQGQPTVEVAYRTRDGGAAIQLVTRNTYDALGRLTSRTDPMRTTNYTYTPLGKPDTECVPASPTVCESHGYDAQGRETSVTHRDGSTESTGFDENGNVIAHTDMAGRTTRTVYDEANRPTAVVYPDDTPATDADNPFTASSYDAAGRLKTSSDELGHTTTYDYDDAGRRTSVTDALGHTTTTHYDARGRRDSVTDANGHTTKFVYDDAGRLTDTILPDDTASDADNPRTHVDYDATGRKLAETDPAGRTTRYDYDDLGRLITVVLANPTTGANPPLVNGASPDSGTLTTHYRYDSVGNKLAQTDANGHSTTWVYDSEGHPLSRTLPGGQRENFTYDYLGRLNYHQHFNGFAIRPTYDAADRVTKLAYQDGTSVTYTYTASGKVHTATDSNGITTYDYDARDRLSQVTWPSGQSIGYSYDAAGNRTQLSTANQQVTFGFDELNRLDSVTAANANAPAPASPLAVYGYDNVGNRQSIVRANGTSTSYGYNPRNQLTTISHRIAAGALALGLSYQLDASGMRTGLDESNATGPTRSTTWQYDGVKRLTQEAVTASAGNGDNRTTNWTYDAVGNRLTQAKVTASGSASTTYAYDNDDRLTTETTSVTGTVADMTAGTTNYSYDPAGNLIQTTSPAGLIKYAYNQADRLAQITAANGDITKYAYAHDGIRLNQTQHANTASAQTTHYLIDPNQAYAQVIEEQAQQGSGAKTLAAIYTFADDRIAETRYDVASGNGQSSIPALRYYHADGLGSTRLLSDDAGSVTDNYAFEAFGGVDASATQATTPNDFLYASEQFDAGFGQYYLRARYMNPSLGRFTQQDTFLGISTYPQSLNKYLYGDSCPVNELDPGGNMDLTQQAVAVSAVAALAGAVLSYKWAMKRHRTELYASGLPIAKADARRHESEVMTTATAQTLAKEYKMPIIFFDSESMPAITRHITSSIENGSPNVLTRTDSYNAMKNRLWAYAMCAALSQPFFPRTPGANSCDEYPFASTQEGGMFATIWFSPVSEQNRQGGLISSFYTNCRIRENDPEFGVFAVVPVVSTGVPYECGD